MNEDKPSVVQKIWEVIVGVLSRKKKEENKIETPKENEIKIEKKAIVILTFLSIVIIGIVIAVLFYIKTTVSVPNVVGMTLQKAKDSITGNNLLEVSVEPSDADDNWKVTGQNPQGGRVRRGATIELWAKPPEKIEHPKPEKPEVPPLESKSENEAKLILGKIGLKWSITKEYSDKKEGTVIAQKPLPHTPVEPGSTVKLTVAKWVKVPNVVGMTLQKAKDSITGNNLLEVSVEPSGARENWKVTGQNPQGGRVRRGATIELWAKPPEKIEHPKPEKPEVPPLEGKSEKEAKSIPPIETQVPNVIGMTLEQTKREIPDDFFEINIKPPHARDDWKVATQTPEGNREYPKGTKITIEITPPPPPLPPDDNLDKLYRDALEEMRQGRYQEAIRLFEEVLSRSNRNWKKYDSTCWNLILLYASTGVNWDRALEILNSVERNVYYYYYSGIAYYMKAQGMTGNERISNYETAHKRLDKAWAEFSHISNVPVPSDVRFPSDNEIKRYILYYRAFASFFSGQDTRRAWREIEHLHNNYLNEFPEDKQTKIRNAYNELKDE